MNSYIKLLLLIIFLISIEINAQNLLLNSDFENYNYIPNYNTLWDSAYSDFPATNWYKLPNSTPDYFHEKSISPINNPNSILGFTRPINGQAYIGFSPFSLDGTVEFISGHFNTPLIKGMLYEISFYYKFLGNGSFLKLNQLEILITSSLSQIKDYTFVNSQNIMPKSCKANVLFTDNLINDGEWHKIIGQYKANGGEKYLTFGTFYHNANLIKQIQKYMNIGDRTDLDIIRLLIKNIDFITINANYIPQKYIAPECTYYYLDNISVTEINP